MRTIAHISDLHFGREDPPVMRALAEDLANKNPSLLIVSGDFTQRARVGQYRKAAEYLRHLPHPQLVIPGNHDIPLYNLFRRFGSPLGRYARYITPDLRPTYRDDEIIVAGLNTARPFSFSQGFWKDGRISDDQLQDLRLRLSSAGPEVFKIVVTHHPFIPPPGARAKGMIVGRAKEALAIMQECHVDLLLAGHLHRGYSGDVRAHFETVQRSIISLQAGTALSTRRRDEPNGYNLITIDDHELTIEVRAYDSGKFHSIEVHRYRKKNEIWIL